MHAYWRYMYLIYAIEVTIGILVIGNVGTLTERYSGVRGYTPYFVYWEVIRVDLTQDTYLDCIYPTSLRAVS